jgi:hypothetical protein
MQHYLERLPGAVAKRAATQFVTETLTGRPTANADLVLSDLRSLADEDRTLEQLVRAISPDEPGRSSPTPWFQRSAFDDLLTPAVTVIARDFPPPDHRSFTRLVQARDYRSQEFLAGVDGISLEPVTESGELTDFNLASLSFDTTTATVRRFGRIATIPVEQFVNDAARVFGSLATSLVRAAYRLEAASTFAVLEANPTLNDGDTLFVSSNTATGATAVGALESGLAKFAEQAVSPGAYAAVQPRTLVLPASWPSLSVEISHLAARNVRVLVSPHVTSAFLLADPNEAPTLALFVFGDGRPRVEINPRRSARYGAQLSVEHAFDVQAVSRVGVVKMTVAS